MASWQGTIYNERLVNSVHNALVDIHLNGVKGVSPDRGYAWKMISPEEADRWIAKARVNYAKLVDQKPPQSAKIWFKHNVRRLDDLINKAVAVREGRTSQKMTESDYAELRKHLGLR